MIAPVHIEYSIKVAARIHKETECGLQYFKTKVGRGFSQQDGLGAATNIRLQPICVRVIERIGTHRLDVTVSE